MLEREIPEQIHQCIILCVAGGRNYFQGEKTGGIPGETGFPCFAMGQKNSMLCKVFLDAILSIQCDFESIHDKLFDF